MIRLTRLNGGPLVLNSDLIEHIEVTPDTLRSLVLFIISAQIRCGSKFVCSSFSSAWGGAPRTRGMKRSRISPPAA